MSFTVSGTAGLTFPDASSQTTAATASIPAGAKTNFFQAAAPTGWTQCTSYSDYAIRIVSGTGAGTGGSVAFTTAFSSSNAGATTLSTCQIPSHTHTLAVYDNCGSGLYTRGNASSGYGLGSVTTAARGGGTSHTHTLSLAVKYIDNIIATKN